MVTLPGEESPQPVTLPSWWLWPRTPFEFGVSIALGLLTDAALLVMLV